MRKIAFIYLNDSVRNYPQVHMGLASIVTFLSSFGHEVKIFDTFYDSDESIINDIIYSKYDFIGFSITEIHFLHAVSITDQIKKFTNTPIIFGGVFPTICPNDCLKIQSIDMVCVGEGEYALQELLNKNSPENIRGIWFKKDDKIINNGVSKSFNVNSFEITDYSFFHKNSVVQKRQYNSTDIKFSFVWRSRGCPYHCSYCCNNLIRNIQGDGIRYREVASVLQEIMQLSRQYNVNEIFFTDENFMFNKRFVQEFCLEYQNSNLIIPFGILSTPNFINKNNIDILLLLKKTGLNRIHMGIEIGNEKLRKEYLERDFNNRSIIQAFNICHELNIFTRAFVMVGFYFESEKNIKETQNLISMCQPDELSCSIFFPFKGTKLREVYERKKLLNNNVLLINNYFEECKILHPNLSPQRLQELRNDILSNYQ